MCGTLPEACWVSPTLRKLKKHKGFKALTESVIDKLQKYFGIALRANTGGTVQRIAAAIWPSFLHVASNEKSYYHDLCEKSPTNWCQHQRDQFNNTNLFQHGTGLPNDVIAHVKPIYKDLIKHEELKSTFMAKPETKMKVSTHEFGNVLRKVFIFRSINWISQFMMPLPYSMMADRIAKCF